MVDIVKQDTHCEPSEPPPVPPTTDEVCEGTLQGTIQGTVRMECCCCCPQLQTRTFVLNIGPQSEGSLITFLANTANAWETSGYRVLAHSIVDAGAGWIFALTVAWYA